VAYVRCLANVISIVCKGDERIDKTMKREGKEGRQDEKKEWEKRDRSGR
jgi:hypothetical protein